MLACKTAAIIPWRCGRRRRRRRRNTPSTTTATNLRRDRHLKGGRVGGPSRRWLRSPPRVAAAPPLSVGLHPYYRLPNQISWLLSLLPALSMGGGKIKPHDNTNAPTPRGRPIDPTPNLSHLSDPTLPTSRLGASRCFLRGATPGGSIRRQALLSLRGTRFGSFLWPWRLGPVLDLAV